MEVQRIFWRDTRPRIGYQPAPCLLLKIREPAVANASAEPVRTPLGRSAARLRIKRPPSPRRPPKKPPEALPLRGRALKPILNMSDPLPAWYGAGAAAFGLRVSASSEAVPGQR